MEYVTVFDASTLRPNLTYAWVGLAGIGLGSVLVYGRPQLESLGLRFSDELRKFSWHLLVLSSVATALLVPLMLLNTGLARASVEPGACAVIEGRVTKFHPMPVKGHDHEHFEVAGITFRYSDYEAGTNGFNNTASHGGPVREGLPVRICHSDGRIRKLEIARAPAATR